MFRIGFSEDIHKFEEGRKLYLGGIYIPNEIGLAGHSDADVVLHAVSESILGALALGDLGTHFPDDDTKYEGISSVLLLQEVVMAMEKRKYRINNIDIQIATKHPRINPLVEPMRMKIASLLKTSVSNVSIKAMTFNEIGPIGNGDACKASSIVLLVK